MKCLHVHTNKLFVPLDDIVDAVEIMLRRCDEDSLFEEVALKKVLTLGSTMGLLGADAGQVAVSVRPT